MQSAGRCIQWVLRLNLGTDKPATLIGYVTQQRLDKNVMAASNTCDSRIVGRGPCIMKGN
jgi:hypothetical protein